MHQHPSAKILRIATISLGGLGLVLFGLFLFNGPPVWIHLGLSPAAALGLDALLSLLFFVQHSGMLRRTTRQAMARRMPASHLDAAYALASGLLLVVLVVFWQPTPRVIISLSGWGYGLARACFGLAVLGFAWTAWHLGPFDPLGAKALMEHAEKTEPPDMPLSFTGPYAWVRHPFYFFSIVMIWSFPQPTLDRLMFNLIWTVWIWLGSVLEERDLVRAHGQDYRDYQQSVPMLLPLMPSKQARFRK